MEPNTDITSARREYFFDIPLVSFMGLVDNRDRAVMNLCGNALCYIILGMSFIVVTNNNIVGFLYFCGMYLFFFERFVLGLHFASHRRLSSFCIVNHVPQMLAPMFGIPWLMYRPHHLMIHHKHGNAHPGDISSTEMYQRDNWVHLGFYCARFLFMSALEVPCNMFVHGHSAVGFFAFLGFCTHVLVHYLLYSWNWTLFVWALGLPALVSPILLAMGNWSQHIFIDQRDPTNPYCITYDIVNSRKNQETFNDGYHVQHHLFPRCHWSELPATFEKQKERHVEEKGFIFTNTSFMHVGFLVVTKNYERLDQHLIYLADPLLTKSERQKLMRDRLRPVHRWKSGEVIQ